MLMRYASSQKVAMKLWEEYGEGLKNAGNNDRNLQSWKYGQFDNDLKISTEARRLYRSRPDLQKTFANPYSVVEQCFFGWWNAEVEQGNDTSVNSVIVKKRTLIQIVKSTIRVLKHEGIKGLIRRVL